MLKVVRGVLRRFIHLSLILPILFSIHRLPGQVPDYNIHDWIDNEFNRKVNSLFKTLTLQTSHHHLMVTSAGDRLVLGGMVVMASSLNESELLPVKGKAGILPALEADLMVTSNLSLNGLYSAFSSHGDVMNISRYGLSLLFEGSESASSRWAVNVQRSQLEGPEDFFLKTVGVAIIRQINYTSGYWWFGVGSGFYNGGIHVKEKNGNFLLHDRLQHHKAAGQNLHYLFLHAENSAICEYV